MWGEDVATLPILMGGARVLRGRRGQRPRGSWIASRCASFDIRQNPRLEYARRHVDQVGPQADRPRTPAIPRGRRRQRSTNRDPLRSSRTSRGCRARPIDAPAGLSQAVRAKARTRRDGTWLRSTSRERSLLRALMTPQGQEVGAGQWGKWTRASSQLKTMSWVRVPGGRIATIPPRRHILLSATRLIQLEQSAEYVLLGGLAISRIGDFLGLQTICQGWAIRMQQRRLGPALDAHC